MVFMVESEEEKEEREKKEDKPEELIRVYPKKKFIGWQIPVPGGRYFQPQSAKEYLEIPISLKEEAQKSTYLTITEEKKNG